jgi:HlyD family secretion protein
MRRLLVIFVGVLLVRCGGAWSAYAADNAKPAIRPATATQAAPGKKITAVGTIEPEEVVDVCAQVAGAVVGFGADPHAPGKSIDWGSSVVAGTVLAQIDSEVYTARVEREQAACMRAEAELDQAKINLERAEFQWKHAQDQIRNKTISDSDFDLARGNDKAAKASVAVAEAMLAQNKAELKQAEIELSHTTIKSPIVSGGQRLVQFAGH